MAAFQSLQSFAIMCQERKPIFKKWFELDAYMLGTASHTI